MFSGLNNRCDYTVGGYLANAWVIGNVQIPAAVHGHSCGITQVGRSGRPTITVTAVWSWEGTVAGDGGDDSAGIDFSHPMSVPVGEVDVTGCIGGEAAICPYLSIDRRSKIPGESWGVEIASDGRDDSIRGDLADIGTLTSEVGSAADVEIPFSVEDTTDGVIESSGRGRPAIAGFPPEAVAGENAKFPIPVEPEHEAKVGIHYDRVSAGIDTDAAQ